MTEHYLAFDLGAQSGRAIWGTLDDTGYLRISELHRFPNRMINILGNLHWDVLELYAEILEGMHICAMHHAPSPTSLGIDTWGVDFGLFDAQGKMIGIPFAYRDRRNLGAREKFFLKMPRERLYQLTGIQFLNANTVFQLDSMVRSQSPQLEIAADLLFMPDIFNYFLTGVKKTELTFATTSQLYNPRTGSWESEIFRRLSVPESIMQDIVPPGTIIGEITGDIRTRTGLEGTPVTATASHDTGAAVAAVPATDDNFAYISSGTWSCMGIESRSPIIDEKYHFTNEGGICGTFRVLKNITGLWLLYQYRRQWPGIREHSYAELIETAQNAGPFTSIIDPNYPGFSNPTDMSGAIEDFCRESNQPVPRNTGQFVRTILESIAIAYRSTLEKLQEISDKNIERIHIVGGGAQNNLLCQFTADATGLPVQAGPVEATAIGNILVQAIASGKISSHAELREIVGRSFPLKCYEPHHTSDWDGAYERFLKLKKMSPEN